MSLPYLDGPKLEWLEEPRVRCLWPLPITASERAFKRQNGAEALEQAFERAKLDAFDPLRRSVV